jgi:hypothetical protein
MNISEARKLAERHVSDEMIVLEDCAQKCDFGFYFAIDSRKHHETGHFEDILVGCSGLLVDRETGEVHELGSAFDLEYWFEAYRRFLHVPNNVIVTKVFDRQRAADALCRLQMTYVIPEKAHGETWRIPKHYNAKMFKKTFDNLPAQYENQNLIFRLREIENIESEHDLAFELQPVVSAEQRHAPDGQGCNGQVKSDT